MTVTNREIQLTSFGAKNVTVTNRGVQLTSFGAKNVTVTNRDIQLASFGAKNVMNYRSCFKNRVMYKILAFRLIFWKSICFRQNILNALSLFENIWAQVDREP